LALSSAQAQPQTIRAEESARARYVVMTHVSADDPYIQAAKLLVRYRSGHLLRFAPGRVQRVLGTLRRLRPEFVAIVVRPEILDVNLAYEVLELSTKLDNDPFPDFTYGFITGATSGDAAQFVRNIISAEEQWDPLPLNVVALGPSSVPQADAASGLGWLSSARGKYLPHWPGRLDDEMLQELSTGTAIRLWGHGTPRGVRGGLTFREVLQLRFFPAVVFSGPCFSAVSSRSYRWCCRRAAVTAERTPPEETIALAFIRQGVVGYLGALHEDRCTTAGQEMEYALTTGSPLGSVIKQTIDRVVMAAQGHALSIPRLTPGARPPSEDGVEFQVHRAASRILLGDPAYRPFARSASPPVTVTARRSRTGLRVTARITDPRPRSTFVDVFRSDGCRCGRANDVLNLKVRVPGDLGRIDRIEYLCPACEDERIDLSPAAWALESWRGARLLHVRLAFSHDTLKRQGFTIRLLIHEASP